MSNNDTALMAHLLRRAGFGANRDELERYLEQGYEATVEELLEPADANNMPDDLIRRYHVEQSELRDLAGSAAYWDVSDDQHPMPAGGKGRPVLARPARYRLHQAQPSPLPAQSGRDVPPLRVGAL